MRRDPLTRYACTHCGHWQPWFPSQKPLSCPVCSDVRNALPPDGWHFATVGDAADSVKNLCYEAMPGVHGVHATPQFGLGSTGWVIQAPGGNVAFEAAPFYTDAGLQMIDDLGGVKVLAASHPHGYGALWQLQERYQPTLVIHKDDVRYTKAFRVTWPADDAHELAPGLTMRHVGGHYEGQMVLFDEARKALFAGDALKIDFAADGRPRAISCHKGYHYEIPLSHGEIRNYRRVFAELPFEHVFTPFEYAAGVTRDHALALFDRLLSGPPTADPVELELL